MMPSQHMTATPISAASVLSITLVMTARIVSPNTISVSHCIGSMGFSLVVDGRFDGRGSGGGTAPVFFVRLPAHDCQHDEEPDHVGDGNVPAVPEPQPDRP